MTTSSGALASVLAFLGSIESFITVDVDVGKGIIR